MAILNNYSTAEAVEAALNKGVEAYAASEQNKTDILSVEEDLTNVADEALEYKTRSTSSISEGWVLLESGFCKKDEEYVLKKYTVTAGDTLKVNSDHLFQFQTSANVPANGDITRVGQTYKTGVYHVKVPDTATFLIVSTKQSNSTADVKSIVKNNEIEQRTLYSFGCEVGNISSGKNDGNQSRCRTKAFIPVRNGDILRCTGEYDYIVWYYDKDKTYLNNTDWCSNDITINIDSVAFIRVSVKTHNSATVTPEMVKPMTESITFLRTDILTAIYKIEDTYPEATKVSGVVRNIGKSYVIESGSISGKGVNQVASARCRTKDYIPFTGGKIIPTGLSYAWIMMYDSDKKVIAQSTEWVNVETDISADNLAYIRVIFRKADYANISSEEAYEIASEFVIVRALPDYVFDATEKIPSYFQEEVERVREKLENYCTEKALVYAVVTDSHVGKSEDNVSQALWNSTVRNIDAVNKAYPLDSLIHLGDIVNGSLPKEDTLNIIRSIRNNMTDIISPNFMLVGNHDLNTFYNDMSEPITEAEMYSVWMRYAEKEITKRPSAKPYWYKDYEQFGIRVIYLSASMGDGTHGGLAENWGYPIEEVNWFTEEALDTDKQILMFSHMPMSQGYIFGDASLPHNGNLMKQAVDAFKTNGGTVIGLINGHTHWDYKHDNGRFCEVSLGAEVITDNTVDKTGSEIASYVPDTAVMYGRVVGTVTQDLWSILVVRPESKTCKIIRFGAGNDITWSY